MNRPRHKESTADRILRSWCGAYGRRRFLGLGVGAAMASACRYTGTWHPKLGVGEA